MGDTQDLHSKTELIMTHHNTRGGFLLKFCVPTETFQTKASRNNI